MLADKFWWLLWQDLEMSASKLVCMSDYDLDLLITGYIRCIICSEQNIPSDIVNSCLMLLYVDEWDFNNDTNNWLSTVPSDDPSSNTIVPIRLYHKFRNGHETIRGKLTISKLTAKKIWKIECVKPNNEGNNDKFYFIVGLLPSYQSTKALTGILSYNGYGFDAHNATFKHNKINVISYLDIPKQGDVINVVYRRVMDDYDNEIKGELSFSINDGKMIRATAQIPIAHGEKYKIAVSFWSKDTIKLLQ